MRTKPCGKGAQRTHVQAPQNWSPSSCKSDFHFHTRFTPSLIASLQQLSALFQRFPLSCCHMFAFQIICIYTEFFIVHCAKFAVAVGCIHFEQIKCCSRTFETNMWLRLSQMVGRQKSWKFNAELWWFGELLWAPLTCLQAVGGRPCGHYLKSVYQWSLLNWIGCGLSLQRSCLCLHIFDCIL